MADTPENKRNGLSRRGFLKGIGVTSVATGLITPSNLEAALAAETKVVGPGELPVTLKINGQTRSLNIEPRVTLLDAFETVWI